RVRGCLDPDEPGVATHRARDRSGSAHVDRGERDSGAVEGAGKEPVRSSIYVVPHDDVVAAREQMRDGIAGGHPRSEGKTPAPALEVREARFERGTRGVAGPRVLVALVLPDRL